ncbi:MAG TPA: flagellar protein FlgN [Armatimonadota bacterium]|jgi:flagellar biosynthesis/type III secretory pathway chaperone
MDETLNTLQNILSRQIAIYGELASLAEQQREALIYRRTDALSEIAVAQTKLIGHSVRLDLQVKDALNAAGLPSLAEAIQQAEEKTSRRLQDLRGRVVAAAEQLSRISRINAELFENAMDSIRFTIQILAGAAQTPEPCYALADKGRGVNSFLVDHHA